MVQSFRMRNYNSTEEAIVSVSKILKQKLVKASRLLDLGFWLINMNINKGSLKENKKV